MRSMRSRLTRAASAAVLLSLAACNGLNLGDNPGREFPKETGALTVPPAMVREKPAR